MNTHRSAALATVLAGLTLLIGCSGNSTTVTSSIGSSTVTTPPPAVDRTSAAAVAAAFAADYAGGNTPAACSLASSALVSTMTTQGLCTAVMSWREVPTQIEACPIVNGQAHFVYQVDHEIERFLIFGIKLTATAGVWTVNQLGGHTPGDKDYGCSAPNSAGGGG